MMIDFALEAERDQGMAPEQAIYQACLLRFRPIMMTTMAALLGGLPLALGTGMGSELRRPLGITIVGGLLISQVLDALHDAGRLPLHGPPRPLAAAHPRSRQHEPSAGPAEARVSISSPFIRATRCDLAARRGAPARGHPRVHAAARRAAAASRLPDHPGERVAPRRQPGDDGLVRGDASRAALRPHRGAHRDDIDEHARRARRSRLQFDLDRNVDAARTRRARRRSPPPAASCRRTCRSSPRTAR